MDYFFLVLFVSNLLLIVYLLILIWMLLFSFDYPLSYYCILLNIFVSDLSILCSMSDKPPALSPPLISISHEPLAATPVLPLPLSFRSNCLLVYSLSEYKAMAFQLCQSSSLVFLGSSLLQFHQLIWLQRCLWPPQLYWLDEQLPIFVRE